MIKDILIRAIVSSTIAGSIIVITLSILKPVTGRLFNARWHYLSVLLSMMFFIIPCWFTINTASMPKVTELQELAFQVNPTREITYSGVRLKRNIKMAEQRIEAGRADVAPAASYLTLSSAAREHKATVLSIWLLGFIVFAAVKLKQYFSLRRVLLSTSEDIVDSKMLDIFYECKRKMNIKRDIKLMSSSCIFTPVITGIVKPMIIVPAVRIEADDLLLVFMHELTHHRRRDKWFKLLALLVNAVHWFNPLSYVVRQQTNDFCETSCDETIVEAMDLNSRMRYGEMLLNLLAKGIDRRLELGSALSQKRKGIRRRLTMIKNYKKTKKSMVIMSLTALLIICVAGVSISSLAFAAMKDTTKDISTNNTHDADENTQIQEGEDTQIQEDENAWILKYLNEEVSYGGFILEQLTEFIEYKKKNTTEGGDLGLELAEFFLQEAISLKDQNYFNDYQIYAQLVGINKDNFSREVANVEEFLGNVWMFAGFTSDSEFCNSDMELLYESRNIRSTSKINNVEVSNPVYLIYKNSQGKISKIRCDDSFHDKVDRGINPLN